MAIEIPPQVGPLPKTPTGIEGMDAITARTEGEHYLQAVLNSLASHIAVLDGAGVIVAVNRAWTAFAQANGDPTLAHTGIGVNYLEAVRRGQDTDASVRDILGDILDGLAAVMAGTLPSYSIEYPCFWGERHDWFLLTATPLTNGRRRGIVVAHQDITLRKQAEDALRRQAQETLALVEHNRDPIGRFDRQLRHLYVNAAVEQTTGLHASAFLGKTNRELKTMPPEIIDLWEEAQARVFATGREQTIQFVQQGSECPVVYETRFAPEYSTYGRVETILSISRDVTARVMAEETQRRHAQEFRALIEHNPDMVARLDRDLRYRYLNPVLLCYLGLPLDQCVGKSYRELGLAESVADRLETALRAAVEQGQEQALDLDIELPDGPRWLNIRLVPETADDGTVATILAIGRDVTQRRLAAQALRESEARFRRLAENAQDLIYRLEFWPERRFAYVSPAATRITGYTPEEHYADPELGHKLVFAEDRPLIAALLQSPEQLTAPLELRWQRKDGTVIWTEQRNVPVYDESGRLIALEGIVRDITARKRTEAQLRILSRTVEQSPVSITLTDTEGRVEYVNRRFTELTGFTLDDVRGSRPHILSDDTNQPEVARQLWQAVRAGQEWRGTLRNTTKAGLPYWEAGTVLPILDGAGRVTHYVALMEDITRLRQQEQEREALLVVATALRIPESPAEVVAAVLQQVSTIFGPAKACFCAPDALDHALDHALVLERAYEFGTPLPVARLRFPLDQGITGQVYRTGQAYLNNEVWSDPLAADDRVVLGAAQAAACVPLLSQQSQILGVLWVTRALALTFSDLRLLIAISDIAANALRRATLHEQVVDYAAHLEEQVAARTRELSEANEQLQELDRLKSKFVSNVTHELRTPITNLNLYLKLLARKPENQAKYTAVLTEQAERLGTLVKDVLDLSRLDQQRDLVKRAPLDLNEVVQMVVAAHAARAEALGLALSFAPDAALPPLQGDRDKLLQVVTNLVANALNYTPAGAVALRTYCDAARTTVYCEVEDTGCGIYDEDLPHLFDRFYRGKRDQAAPVPGTGLGLSIVKELVELHRGAITVVSAVGVGSTFTVSLPVA